MNKLDYELTIEGFKDSKLISIGSSGLTEWQSLGIQPVHRFTAKGQSIEALLEQISDHYALKITVTDLNKDPNDQSGAV